MRNAETWLRPQVQRLPGGLLIVRDGAGEEVRLTPADAPDLASTLMDLAADADDWPDAQLGGAT